MKPTMTTADIAALAGVTRRHATGQIVKRPGFPAPCINASQRLRAWPTKKVLAYFQGIGRTIEPASGTPEFSGTERQRSVRWNDELEVFGERKEQWTT